MDFLIKPLALTLPFGSFNGSSIVDPQLRPIEQHLIPVAVVPRAIELLEDLGVDIWLFTNEQWLTRNPHGEYVGREQRAIKHDPDIVDSFAPFLDRACKIVGASSDPGLLVRCEAAMRQAVGTQATAVRSQTFYLDITPPGHDKGTFVADIAARLGIPLDAVATIGDMENDLPMFARSGVSFAMGNAADEIKRHATHVTASNEQDGFAKAMEVNSGPPLSSRTSELSQRDPGPITTGRCCRTRCGYSLLQQSSPVVMGPGFRRDDSCMRGDKSLRRLRRADACPGLPRRVPGRRAAPPGGPSARHRQAAHARPERQDQRLYILQSHNARRDGGAHPRLHRLRFSNHEKTRITPSSRNHLVFYSDEWSDPAVRRWIKRVCPTASRISTA